MHAYIHRYIHTYIRTWRHTDIASRPTVDLQGNHTAAAVFSALWFHVWLQMRSSRANTRGRTWAKIQDFTHVKQHMLSILAKTCNGLVFLGNHRLVPNFVNLPFLKVDLRTTNIAKNQASKPKSNYKVVWEQDSCSKTMWECELQCLKCRQSTVMDLSFHAFCCHNPSVDLFFTLSLSSSALVNCCTAAWPKDRTWAEAAWRNSNQYAVPYAMSC